MKHKAGVDPDATKERTAWIERDGVKLTRVTFPNVHRGEIPPKTADSIRNQLGLSRVQFEAFHQCPMTRQEFDQHLETLK
jgi:hypothetical protein